MQHLINSDNNAGFISLWKWYCTVHVYIIVTTGMHVHGRLHTLRAASASSALAPSLPGGLAVRKKEIAHETGFSLNYRDNPSKTGMVGSSYASTLQGWVS